MVSWGDDGIKGPVRVLHGPMAAVLATRLAQELRAAEAFEEAADFTHSKSHLVFEAVDYIAHSLPVVDLARSVIGDSVLLWDSNVRINPAGSTADLTWHQDAVYLDLDPLDAAVSIWVALTPATVASGAISYLPGSHRLGLAEHRIESDPDDDPVLDVRLHRGERIENVDDRRAVCMELDPGQATAHHPLIVHGTGPNQTDQDRVGVGCVYVPDTVRSVGRRVSAQVVSGLVVRSRFQVEPRLDASLSPMARAAHREALRSMTDRIGP